MSTPGRARSQALGWRLLSCAMLSLAGFLLLGTSTFAARLREDVPRLVPGLSGPDGIAFVLALALGFLPMASRRRRTQLYALSAFLFTLIGAYGWTTIPWDELITETNFNNAGDPSFSDFARVALPAALLALDAIVLTHGGAALNYLERGADPDEARAVERTLVAAGSAAVVVSALLASLLWIFLSR